MFFLTILDKRNVYKFYKKIEEFTVHDIAKVKKKKRNDEIRFFFRRQKTLKFHKKKL